MSAVETIRDIPVIVKHRKGCRQPMDFDYNYSSGFPFDNSGRRSRDPLDDIAQRHPEFAQHLQGFPRRAQRGGGSDQNQDDFLRRRFERPFSSGRFERFGFPFERDDFEREPQRYYEAYPEYFENFQNQQPQSPQQQQSSSSQTPSGFQQYPPQYSQEYNPLSAQQQTPDKQQQQPPQYQTQASQSVSQGTQTDEGDVQTQAPQAETNQQQEVKSEGGQTRGRPIQQSNTCDLSQHQPPDEALNEREQRSMSAPPENKRFTSSVNIPMGVNQENSPGVGAQSQAGSGSTERVIPIHVEGRDDPVVPTRFAGATQTPPPQQQHHQQQPHHQQPQPERIFNDGPRSQPETIFGRRPEAFTQFMHRDSPRFSNDWPHSFGGFPEDDFGFRRSESPSRFAGHNRPQTSQPQQAQQNVHRPETAPPQAQAPKPQQQQQQQQPQQEAPQQPKPQQQKQPATPIEQIQAIQKDVSTLLRQVEAFKGVPRDKNYLYLDEMLTRNLLKLDNVDTQGQDSIRSARKEAIKSIERTISLLEEKAAANVAPKEDKMEVEQSKDTQEVEKMDTERQQEPTTMEMSPPPSQSENMDVAQDASQGENSKSGEGEANEQQQPKSADDAVAKTEAEAKSEEVKVEPSNVDSQGSVEATKSETGETPAEGSKSDVKEGEKKEKKKIKKKVNKEDKEKK